MSEPAPPTPITRRRFLGRLALGAAALATGLATDSLVETHLYRISRRRIPVPHLPPEFAGTTVALLTDIHHGPTWGLNFVRSVVEDTNRLGADVIALGGDYVHRSPRYIEPCIAALSKLWAPLGVYAVLGNHDHWENASRTRAALRRAAITDLSNTGLWLRKGPARLRLGGVDDLWEGRQDLGAALGDCSGGESALLLCHNPDYVERIRDRRVGLVLSGHTHGGQVSLPLLGPPIIPSDYGDKYAHGLVKTPYTQVYVSRGLGTINPAVRFNCPAEIVLITLSPSY